MRRNPYLCVVIVVILGVVAVAGVVGVIVLSVVGREIPPALVGLSASAVGALSSWSVPATRDGLHRATDVPLHVEQVVMAADKKPPPEQAVA